MRWVEYLLVYGFAAFGLFFCGWTALVLAREVYRLFWPDRWRWGERARRLEGRIAELEARDGK